MVVLQAENLGVVIAQRSHRDAVRRAIERTPNGAFFWDYRRIENDHELEVSQPSAGRLHQIQSSQIEQCAISELECAPLQSQSQTSTFHCRKQRVPDPESAYIPTSVHGTIDIAVEESLLGLAIPKCRVKDITGQLWGGPLDCEPLVRFGANLLEFVKDENEVASLLDLESEWLRNEGLSLQDLSSTGDRPDNNDFVHVSLDD